MIKNKFLKSFFLFFLLLFSCDAINISTPSIKEQVALDVKLIETHYPPILKIEAIHQIDSMGKLNGELVEKMDSLKVGDFLFFKFRLQDLKLIAKVQNGVIFSQFMLIKNLKKNQIRILPILDLLWLQIQSPKHLSDFYSVIPNECSFWTCISSTQFREDAPFFKKGNMQSNVMPSILQNGQRIKLREEISFKTFSFKNSPYVSILNELLATYPNILWSELEILLQQSQNMHFYCPPALGDTYNVDTQKVQFYHVKKTTVKTFPKDWCFPAGWLHPPKFKDFELKIDSIELNSLFFRWDNENKHLAPDTSFSKYGFKFVSLTPAQVRTMRLPALCPPRDSLTAIADYIDQTQPTFIFFKKYFQACEPTYNYFLLYYFDFPEGKAPILRDIRVVVPDNFGLNIPPN
jgi:hypothetical protein